MSAGEWVAGVDTPNRVLPPALLVKGPKCFTTGPLGMGCLRMEGHTGRHAAHGVRYVLAVWHPEPAVSEPPC